ncbi:hypothetical protein BC834DRAFT_286120 [Gloeopeniophorella convolvens]|nr:hypothetical protein BC834DRAFT_286120 [Gloeopeniophorella convolvens]
MSPPGPKTTAKHRHLARTSRRLYCHSFRQTRYGLLTLDFSPSAPLETVLLFAISTRILQRKAQSQIQLQPSLRMRGEPQRARDSAKTRLRDAIRAARNQSTRYRDTAGKEDRQERKKIVADSGAARQRGKIEQRPGLAKPRSRETDCAARDGVALEPPSPRAISTPRTSGRPASRPARARPRLRRKHSSFALRSCKHAPVTPRKPARRLTGPRGPRALYSTWEHTNAPSSLRAPSLHPVASCRGTAKPRPPPGGRASSRGSAWGRGRTQGATALRGRAWGALQSAGTAAVVRRPAASRAAAEERARPLLAPWPSARLSPSRAQAGRGQARHGTSASLREARRWGAGVRGGCVLAMAHEKRRARKAPAAKNRCASDLPGWPPRRPTA